MIYPMIAIVKSGGKQYLVQEQSVIKLEKIPGAVGENVSFEVLLLADETGSSLQVGMPTVAKAAVTAKITKQDRADKVITVKFRPKARYTRRKGHRQHFTEVKFGKIG